MRRGGILWLSAAALVAVSLSAGASAAGSGRAARPVRVRQAVEAEGVVGYGTSQVLLFGSYFPSHAAEITRVNLDGSVDRSFGDDGTVHMSAADVVVDPQGRILIANSGGVESGKRRDARVTRLLPDGKRDRSFGVGGNADVHFGRRDDAAQSVAVAPDGDILLAGTQLVHGSRYGDEVILTVARLKPDGELDRSFGRHGIAKLPSGGEVEVFNVAPTPSGGVVVDGGAQGEAAIWKLSRNGSLDRGFGRRGIREMPFGHRVRGGVEEVLYAAGVVVAANGKLLLAASGSIFHGGEKVVAVRLRPDGRLDRTYGSSGWATAARVPGRMEAEGLTLLPDGSLAIGTTFGRDGTGHTAFGVVAFDSGGVLDRGFASRGVCRAHARRDRRADGVARVGTRIVALGDRDVGERWLLGCSLVDRTR
jgi:uncharacterized delta-60 repeat protein